MTRSPLVRPRRDLGPRILTLGMLATLLGPAVAWAKPSAPATLCTTYPTAPACTGSLPACTLCHTAPPERNSYGNQLAAALLPGRPRPLSEADFSAALPAALRMIEAQDADGDGASNADELAAATLPADPRSKPAVVGPCGGSNSYYSLCAYDHDYVFKKVNLDFCGRSPTLDMRDAFAALDAAGKERAIDAALTACLASNHWRGKDGVVWRMAHRKVKPLQAIKSGGNSGIIPLADYDDDYNLYVYANTGDRDVRDVLVANYFVTRADGTPTNYTRVESLGSQSIPVERRSGMLTTRWFLVLNVMFTALPRTAAAQAYRAFLNLDIAKLEGMWAVPNEPVDYDDRGVRQDACKNCHATLDPLTYPFRNYDGLVRNPFGSYVNNRIERFFAGQAPRITEIPEAGYIFGRPVASLVEWGRVAADSEAFASAVVEDYWSQLIGDAPSGAERGEFTALWQALGPTHNYRVESMLKALVRTEAYGVP
jgi:hypothetical protein